MPIRDDKTDDARWMERALTLARRGEGLTRPNPPVGAVVVKGGHAVGEGYHRKAGGPHAEVYALRQAGGQARGATLYVTLEPCSTWGRTPPCTDAVTRAGIRRVVAAMADPNPRHRGRGMQLLRRAGIEVACGVLGREAEVLLRPFVTWICGERPWVILKLGVSLDGRIADAAGRSRWITGPPARRAVQALRRGADAVMVGAGTVVADDPSLLPRPSRGRLPWRVIVDSAGKVSPSAQVLTDAARSRTLVMTTRRCPAARRKACERGGAQVVELPADGHGVALVDALKRLHALGVMRVLCEGGGQLAAGLLRAGLVDELVFFVAPKILGGGAIPAIAGPGWNLTDAPRFQVETVERLGDDVMIRWIRQGA